MMRDSEADAAARPRDLRTLAAEVHGSTLRRVIESRNFVIEGEISSMR
jgi:hypothetical protein